jgi:hypothetical protein
MTETNRRTGNCLLSAQEDIHMNHQTRSLAPSLGAVATALLTLVLLAAASNADDLSSTSYRLRGGTLSGGGGVDLQSTAPTPAIGSAGVTIGQPGPVGISTGPTSGITLHAGFWPIAASDAELLDSDGDGIPDVSDNCIEEKNASQLDTDGDDYGNACDCDFDQNLACSIADFSIFREDYIATADRGVGTDMDGNGAVSIADFSLFRDGYVAGVPGPSGLVP